jgi:hypothetical protein
MEKKIKIAILVQINISLLSLVKEQINLTKNARNLLLKQETQFTNTRHILSIS